MLPNRGLFCYNYLQMPESINSKFLLRFVFIFVIVGHIMLIIQNFNALYEGFTFGLPIGVLYGTLFSFSTSFTDLSLSVFIINISLMSYLITSIITLYKIEKNIFAHSHKIGGASMLAIIGTHCASCGSAILSGIFGTSLGAILPLGGVEFGILSILILLYSSYTITKKLRNPYVC